MKELREKKIPFTIRRYLPDGRWVEWVGVSGLYCKPCILPSTILPACSAQLHPLPLLRCLVLQLRGLDTQGADHH